ncbi:amino acid adenylation domain-containing protein [Chitinophaga sp.]|uniref:amino acid adenylation domain-containing protein n=1 Tax=Chitinophaga sp. TaxID=1869181 RepID=UPI0031D5EA2F
MDKRVLYTVLEEYARDRSSQVAVSWNDMSVTYGALMEYANHLAQQLKKTGLKKGDVVALMVPKSHDYIITMLGVSKAGGVFMPVEPGYPAERMMQIMKVATPRFIIVPQDQLEKRQYHSSARYGTGTLLMNERYDLFVDEFMPRQVVIDLPAEEVVTGDDSCYLMYTSGSTGTPKVIEGMHKSLSHFIHWEVKEFGLDKDTRTGLIAPLSFDVSLRDIYVPLLAGGTLFIPPDGIQQDVKKFIAWIKDSKLSVLHIVPSVLRLLMKELQQEAVTSFPFTSLKYVMTAGEPLYGKDVTVWRRLAGAGVTLVNLYGPSETTLAKLFYRIPQEEIHPDSVVPLGIPLPNTSVAIVNNGRLCNVGDTGEILIKTPFRSKGYYKDPVMTADKFIQNPLQQEFEDIVYKTGDLGKYLPDKSIAFVGRSDTQVKIRGNRVEIAEVEQNVAGFPGVEHNVVTTVTSDTHELSLCCYFISRENITHRAIQEFLKQQLPDYMIPSYFVRLDSFPLNLNGKINKKALPKPEELLYSQLTYEPPIGDLEIAIAAVWSELLGLKKVGRSNTFFELGGHSLIATRITSILSRTLQKDIGLKEFFENNTVAGLAKVLVGKETVFKSEIIAAIPGREYYPVSYAQKRLLILDKKIEQKTLYNMSLAACLNSNTNIPALKRALKKITERHESLRTTFSFANGDLRQHIHPDSIVDITETVITDGTESEVTASSIRAMTERVFNLEGGPLATIGIVQFPGGKYLLLINMHHIISDGWSVGVLVKELAVLYEAFSQGLEDPLPPLRIHYKDYVAWQQAMLANKMDTLKQYWYAELEQELPEINLPYDFPRPAKRSYTGSKHRFSLSRESSDYLRTLAREFDTSLFVVLQSVINMLLYHYSGQQTIVTGTPISGRNHHELENQIGFYLNYLVLKIDLRGSDHLSAFIENVKQRVLDAFDHQDYPYDKLVEDLIVTGKEDRNPFYDVLVVMNNADLNGSHSDFEKLEQLTGLQGIPIEDNISKLDLSFFVSDLNEILVNIEFDTSLFLPATIAAMENDLRSIVDICREALHTLTLSELSYRLSENGGTILRRNNVDIIDEQF